MGLEPVKSDASAVVDVAVAVLERADGRVLLARRPASKVYAGYWEFPGGKVEPGETVRDALEREIQEELGVRVVTAYPWIKRVFTYPHATVGLHFYRVAKWKGDLHPHEHDALEWQRAGAVDVTPVLPANGPVFRALTLPLEYAISQATALGRGDFLRRLARRLEDGLRLVQIREPGWSSEELGSLVKEVVGLARAKGARVVVNGEPSLARDAGADGVHLNSRRLRALAARPALPLVGASCHDAAELRMAEALGVDYVLLGPVLPTPSHPDARPLGWDGFSRLAAGCALPVYALGGVTKAELETSRLNGAHGIAMIRGAWL